MLSYKDRAFCVSKNCTNKCGRQLTDEMREAAAAMELHICVGLFCEDESTTINKILSTVTGFFNFGAKGGN